MDTLIKLLSFKMMLFLCVLFRSILSEIIYEGSYIKGENDSFKLHVKGFANTVDIDSIKVKYSNDENEVVIISACKDSTKNGDSCLTIKDQSIIFSLPVDKSFETIIGYIGEDEGEKAIFTFNNIITKNILLTNHGFIKENQLNIVLVEKEDPIDYSQYNYFLSDLEHENTEFQLELSEDFQSLQSNSFNKSDLSSRTLIVESKNEKVIYKYSPVFFIEYKIQDYQCFIQQNLPDELYIIISHSTQLGQIKFKYSMDENAPIVSPEYMSTTNKAFTLVELNNLHSDFVLQYSTDDVQYFSFNNEVIPFYNPVVNTSELSLILQKNNSFEIEFINDLSQKDFPKFYIGLTKDSIKEMKCTFSDTKKLECQFDNTIVEECVNNNCLLFFQENCSSEIFELENITITINKQQLISMKNPNLSVVKFDGSDGNTFIFKFNYNISDESDELQLKLYHTHSKFSFDLNIPLTTDESLNETNAIVKDNTISITPKALINNISSNGNGILGIYTMRLTIENELIDVSLDYYDFKIIIYNTENVTVTIHEYSEDKYIRGDVIDSITLKGEFEIDERFTLEGIVFKNEKDGQDSNIDINKDTILNNSKTEFKLNGSVFNTTNAGQYVITLKNQVTQQCENYTIKINEIYLDVTPLYFAEKDENQTVTIKSNCEDLILFYNDNKPLECESKNGEQQCMITSDMFTNDVTTINLLGKRNSGDTITVKSDDTNKITLFKNYSTFFTLKPPSTCLNKEVTNFTITLNKNSQFDLTYLSITLNNSQIEPQPKEEHTQWEFKKSENATEETIIISYKSVVLYTIKYMFNDYELPPYIYFNPGETTQLEIIGNQDCKPDVYASITDVNVAFSPNEEDKLIYNLTGLNEYVEHLMVGHFREEIDLVPHINTSLIIVSDLKYNVDNELGNNISFIIKGYPYEYCGIISVNETNFTYPNPTDETQKYEIDTSGSIENGYKITIPITLNESHFNTNTTIELYEKVDDNDTHEVHILTLEHPFKQDPIVAKVDQHHLVRQLEDNNYVTITTNYPGLTITCKDNSQNEGNCSCKALEENENSLKEITTNNYVYRCSIDKEMFPQEGSGSVSKVYFYIEESSSSILPVFPVVYLFNNNYSEYFNIQTCLNVKIKSFDIRTTFNTMDLHVDNFSLLYEYSNEMPENKTLNASIKEDNSAFTFNNDNNEKFSSGMLYIKFNNSNLFNVEIKFNAFNIIEHFYFYPGEVFITYKNEDSDCLPGTTLQITENDTPIELQCNETFTCDLSNYITSYNNVTINIGNFPYEVEFIPNIDSTAVTIEIIKYSNTSITLSFVGFPFDYIDVIDFGPRNEFSTFTQNETFTNTNYTITLSHNIRYNDYLLFEIYQKESNSNISRVIEHNLSPFYDDEPILLLYNNDNKLTEFEVKYKTNNYTGKVISFNNDNVECYFPNDVTTTTDDNVFLSKCIFKQPLENEPLSFELIAVNQTKQVFVCYLNNSDEVCYINAKESTTVGSIKCSDSSINIQSTINVKFKDESSDEYLLYYDNNNLNDLGQFLSYELSLTKGNVIQNYTFNNLILNNEINVRIRDVWVYPKENKDDNKIDILNITFYEEISSYSTNYFTPINIGGVTVLNKSCIINNNSLECDVNGLEFEVEDTISFSLRNKCQNFEYSKTVIYGETPSAYPEFTFKRFYISEEPVDIEISLSNGDHVNKNDTYNIYIKSNRSDEITLCDSINPSQGTSTVSCREQETGQYVLYYNYSNQEGSQLEPLGNIVIVSRINELLSVNDDNISFPLCYMYPNEIKIKADLKNTNDNDMINSISIHMNNENTNIDFKFNENTGEFILDSEQVKQLEKGNKYDIIISIGNEQITTEETTLTIMKPQLNELIPFNTSTTVIEFDGAVCGNIENNIIFTIDLENDKTFPIECVKRTEEQLNENEDKFICEFTNEYNDTIYGKKTLYYEGNKVGEVFISTNNIEEAEFIIDVLQKQPVFDKGQYVIRSINYFVKNIKHIQVQSMINNVSELISDMVYNESDVSVTFNVPVLIGDKLILTGFGIVNDQEDNLYEFKNTNTMIQGPQFETEHFCVKQSDLNSEIKVELFYGEDYQLDTTTNEYKLIYTLCSSDNTNIDIKGTGSVDNTSNNNKIVFTFTTAQLSQLKDNSSICDANYTINSEKQDNVVYIPKLQLIKNGDIINIQGNLVIGKTNSLTMTFNGPICENYDITEIILQSDNDNTIISITRDTLQLLSSNGVEFIYETNVFVNNKCSAGEYSVYLLTKCEDKLKSEITVKVFNSITIEFANRELNINTNDFIMNIMDTYENRKERNISIVKKVNETTYETVANGSVYKVNTENEYEYDKLDIDTSVGVFYIKVTLPDGHEAISDESIIIYSQRTLSLKENELIHEGEMELKNITFTFNEEGVFEGRFTEIKMNNQTVKAQIESITNNSVTFTFEEPQIYNKNIKFTLVDILTSESEPSLPMTYEYNIYIVLFTISPLYITCNDTNSVTINANVPESESDSNKYIFFIKTNDNEESSFNDTTYAYELSDCSNVNEIVFLYTINNKNEDQKYEYSKKAFVFKSITDIMKVTPNPTEQCYYITDNNANQFELHIEPTVSNLYYNDIIMKYIFNNNNDGNESTTPEVVIEYDNTINNAYVYKVELTENTIKSITFTLYEHESKIESFTYVLTNLTLNSDTPVYSFVDANGKGSFMFPTAPQCTMNEDENMFRFDEDNNVEIKCTLHTETQYEYECVYDYIDNEDKQYGMKTMKSQHDDIIGNVFVYKQFEIAMYTVSCESNEGNSTVILKSNEYPINLIKSISIIAKQQLQREQQKEDENENEANAFTFTKDDFDIVNESELRLRYNFPNKMIYMISEITDEMEHSYTPEGLFFEVNYIVPIFITMSNYYYLSEHIHIELSNPNEFQLSTNINVFLKEENGDKLPIGQMNPINNVINCTVDKAGKYVLVYNMNEQSSDVETTIVIYVADAFISFDSSFPLCVVNISDISLGIQTMLADKNDFVLNIKAKTDDIEGDDDVKYLENINYTFDETNSLLHIEIPNNEEFIKDKEYILEMKVSDKSINKDNTFIYSFIISQISLPQEHVAVLYEPDNMLKFEFTNCVPSSFKLFIDDTHTFICTQSDIENNMFIINKGDYANYGDTMMFIEGNENINVFISKNIENASIAVTVPSNQPVIGKQSFTLTSNDYFLNNLSYIIIEINDNVQTISINDIDGALINENILTLPFDISIGDTLTLIAFAKDVNSIYIPFTSSLDANTIKGPYFVPTNTYNRMCMTSDQLNAIEDTFNVVLYCSDDNDANINKHVLTFNCYNGKELRSEGTYDETTRSITFTFDKEKVLDALLSGDDDSSLVCKSVYYVNDVPQEIKNVPKIGKVKDVTLKSIEGVVHNGEESELRFRFTETVDVVKTNVDKVVFENEGEMVKLKVSEDVVDIEEGNYVFWKVDMKRRKIKEGNYSLSYYTQCGDKIEIEDVPIKVFNAFEFSFEEFQLQKEEKKYVNLSYNVDISNLEDNVEVYVIDQKNSNKSTVFNCERNDTDKENECQIHLNNSMNFGSGLYKLKSILPNGNEAISPTSFVLYNVAPLTLEDDHILNEGTLMLSEVTFEFKEGDVFDGRFNHSQLMIGGTVIDGVSIVERNDNSITFKFNETEINENTTIVLHDSIISDESGKGYVYTLSVIIHDGVPFKIVPRYVQCVEEGDTNITFKVIHNEEDTKKGYIYYIHINDDKYEQFSSEGEYAYTINDCKVGGEIKFAYSVKEGESNEETDEPTESTDNEQPNSSSDVKIPFSKKAYLIKSFNDILELTPSPILNSDKNECYYTTSTNNTFTLNISPKPTSKIDVDCTSFSINSVPLTSSSSKHCTYTQQNISLETENISITLSEIDSPIELLSLNYTISFISNFNDNNNVFSFINDAKGNGVITFPSSSTPTCSSNTLQSVFTINNEIPLTCNLNVNGDGNNDNDNIYECAYNYNKDEYGEHQIALYNENIGNVYIYKHLSIAKIDFFYFYANNKAQVTMSSREFPLDVIESITIEEIGDQQESRRLNEIESNTSFVINNFTKKERGVLKFEIVGLAEEKEYAITKIKQNDSTEITFNATDSKYKIKTVYNEPKLRILNVTKNNFVVNDDKKLNITLLNVNDYYQIDITITLIHENEPETEIKCGIISPPLTNSIECDVDTSGKYKLKLSYNNIINDSLYVIIGSNYNDFISFKEEGITSCYVNTELITVNINSIVVGDQTNYKLQLVNNETFNFTFNVESNVFKLIDTSIPHSTYELMLVIDDTVIVPIHSHTITLSTLQIQTHVLYIGDKTLIFKDLQCQPNMIRFDLGDENSRIECTVISSEHTDGTFECQFNDQENIIYSKFGYKDVRVDRSVIGKVFVSTNAESSNVNITVPNEDVVFGEQVITLSSDDYYLNGIEYVIVDINGEENEMKINDDILIDTNDNNKMNLKLNVKVGDVIKVKGYKENSTSAMIAFANGTGILQGPYFKRDSGNMCIDNSESIETITIYLIYGEKYLPISKDDETNNTFMLKYTLNNTDNETNSITEEHIEIIGNAEKDKVTFEITSDNLTKILNNAKTYKVEYYINNEIQDVGVIPKIMRMTTIEVNEVSGVLYKNNNENNNNIVISFFSGKIDDIKEMFIQKDESIIYSNGNNVTNENEGSYEITFMFNSIDEYYVSGEYEIYFVTNCLDYIKLNQIVQVKTKFTFEYNMFQIKCGDDSKEVVIKYDIDITEQRELVVVVDKENNEKVTADCENINSTSLSCSLSFDCDQKQSGYYYIKTVLKDGSEFISPTSFVLYNVAPLTLKDDHILNEGPLMLSEVTFEFKEGDVFDGRFNHSQLMIGGTVIDGVSIVERNDNSITFKFNETEINENTTIVLNDSIISDESGKGYIYTLHVIIHDGVPFKIVPRYVQCVEGEETNITFKVIHNGGDEEYPTKEYIYYIHNDDDTYDQFNSTGEYAYTINDCKVGDEIEFAYATDENLTKLDISTSYMYQTYNDLFTIDVIGNKEACYFISPNSSSLSLTLNPKENISLDFSYIELKYTINGSSEEFTSMTHSEKGKYTIETLDPTIISLTIYIIETYLPESQPIVIIPIKIENINLPDIPLYAFFDEEGKGTLNILNMQTCTELPTNTEFKLGDIDLTCRIENSALLCDFKTNSLTSPQTLELLMNNVSIGNVSLYKQLSYETQFEFGFDEQFKYLTITSNEYPLTLLSSITFEKKITDTTTTSDSVSVVVESSKFEETSTDTQILILRTLFDLESEYVVTSIKQDDNTSLEFTEEYKYTFNTAFEYAFTVQPQYMFIQRGTTENEYAKINITLTAPFTDDSEKLKDFIYINEVKHSCDYNNKENPITCSNFMLTTDEVNKITVKVGLNGEEHNIILLPYEINTQCSLLDGTTPSFTITINNIPENINTLLTAIAPSIIYNENESLEDNCIITGTTAQCVLKGFNQDGTYTLKLNDQYLPSSTSIQYYSKKTVTTESVILIEGESNHEIILTFDSNVVNGEIAEVYVECDNNILFKNETTCDDSTSNTLKCVFNINQIIPNKNKCGLFMKDSCGRTSDKVAIDVKRKLETPIQVTPTKVSEVDYASQTFTLTFNNVDNVHSLIDKVILINKSTLDTVLLPSESTDNTIVFKLFQTDNISFGKFNIQYTIKDSDIQFDTSLSIIIYDHEFTITNPNDYTLTIGSPISSLILYHNNPQFYENRIISIITNNQLLSFDINENTITFKSNIIFNEIGSITLHIQDIMDKYEQRILITEKCEDNSHTVVHPESGKCVRCEALDMNKLYYYNGECLNECPNEAPYSENEICVTHCSEGFGFDMSNMQRCIECTSSHHTLKDDGICYINKCINGLILIEDGKCGDPDNLSDTKLEEIKTTYCGDNGKPVITANHKIQCECNEGFVGINCQYNKSEVNIIDITQQLINDITNETNENKNEIETIARMKDLATMAVKDENVLQSVSNISNTLKQQLINANNSTEHVNNNIINIIGLSLLGYSYKGETTEMNEVLQLAQELNYKQINAADLNTDTAEILDEPSKLVTFRRWNHHKHDDMKKKSLQMGTPFPDMRGVLNKFLEKNTSYKKENIFIYSTDFSSALYHKKYDYKRRLEAKPLSYEASDSIFFYGIAKKDDGTVENINLFDNENNIVPISFPSNNVYGFNRELFTLYKDKGINIYNSSDPAFNDKCYINKEFDYDLTQRYRKKYIYQQGEFIMDDENCTLRNFNDGDNNNTIVYDCVMQENKHYQLSFKAIEIENEDKVENLPIKCAKEITDIERNIAFWLYLIILLLTIGIALVLVFSPLSERIKLKHVEIKNTRTVNTEQSVRYAKAQTTENTEQSEVVHNEQIQIQFSFCTIYGDNFKQLHPLCSLCKVSFTQPVLYLLLILVFNILCIFGWNALYFNENMIEQRITANDRNNFIYPVKAEYGKILSAIATCIALTLIVRAIGLISYESKIKIEQDVKNVDEDEKGERLLEFTKANILRRIISFVFMFVIVIFFFYYTIVFCGVYVNTQYGWFYSGIWSLLFIWVGLAPLYILIITIVQYVKGDQYEDKVVYYLKELFVF